jgi:4-amino-4-deoxy-L-arabinose transferase-like glycosyltransferase
VSSETSSGARLSLVAAALVIALGLFLRLWILGRTPITSDEAVVGLMAREILRGRLFAFYWGQHYGGGEAYVVAALFGVIGRSRITLGLVPVLLDATAALLVWRVGRRLFDPRTAVLAGLIFWVWPEVYLYLSTVEYGFRFLALVCGLAVLLCGLRLADPSASRLYDWAAFGLFTGLGWWCSPEIVYYAFPVLLWLAYRFVRKRARPRPVGVLIALATSALGALPWLAANLGHGFPSLRPVPVAPSQATTWVARLGIFFRHVAPLVFGARLRGSGDWLISPAFGVTFYCLLAGLVLAWIITLAVRRRAAPLVMFVALFPFLYAYSPFAAYWNDGRYAVYLAPVLSLLVASAASELAGRFSLPRLVPALGLVAALALTSGAAARLAPYTPVGGAGSPRSGWTSWADDPRQWLQPLVSALQVSGARDIYAGYWIAYPLTFETGGRIVAGDPGVDRYPPYLEVVARSPRQAWVFPTLTTLAEFNRTVGAHPWLPERSLTLSDFKGYLNSLGVTYRCERAGYFTIVYPTRPVAPPPAPQLLAPSTLQAARQR